ncbi:MAG: fibrobacter succinogenes major paralogous domain-containing protein [Bacteroidales bacterium]|nr:fibrobacter succinogenes major paralogous domain-containing protein [Bacteroidales bacterium]
MGSNVFKAISFFFFLSLLTACKPGQEKDNSSETVSDVDGNSYKTVEIGSQVWMSENLKTTRFSDGSPLALVENYDEWATLSLPAYSWYNNDSLNREEFGALYNYYAIESGELCKEGWHVPTDAEWIELETYFGGAIIAGAALKEEGTDYWKTPNKAATNESGFTARPGGYRSYNGTFNWMRTYGLWWSSTLKSWYGSSPKLVYRDMRYDDQDIRRDIADKKSGLSVCCIKNP